VAEETLVAVVERVAIYNQMYIYRQVHKQSPLEQVEPGQQIRQTTPPVFLEFLAVWEFTTQ
jgi:hypothetical protein